MYFIQGIKPKDGNKMRNKINTRYSVIAAIKIMAKKRFPLDPWRQWSFASRCLRLAVKKGIY